MTKFLGILILSALLSIAACHEKKANNHTQDQVKEIAADFWKFHKDFHADSLFQISHILFPLEGTVADSMSNKKINTRWYRDHWKLHKVFDPMGSTFKRTFYDIGGIVIEKIQSTNGVYSMERRFSRIEDQWMLIYYASMSEN